MRDPGGCVLTGRADCEDLEAQRGRVRRLREAEAADYEIRAAVKGLESVLRSVIIEQGALVRRLRTDGPHQAQYEEAVARLQSLKQDFQEVSGRLWLDVREEGHPSWHQRQEDLVQSRTAPVRRSHHGVPRPEALQTSQTGGASIS